MTLWEPAYKKPIFENHPVLFLIQGCHFQKQPEMFLNLKDKKHFDIQYSRSRIREDGFQENKTLNIFVKIFFLKPLRSEQTFLYAVLYLHES